VMWSCGNLDLRSPVESGGIGTLPYWLASSLAASQALSGHALRSSKNRKFRQEAADLSQYPDARGFLEHVMLPLFSTRHAERLTANTLDECAFFA
jgi:hypothetical protein